MYGRYGSDGLSLFLVSAALVLWIIGELVPVDIVQTVLFVISYVALIFSIFRMFSRNYGRRRSENEKFMSLVSPILQGFQRKRAHMRDKDHVYFRCPNCGQMLRVPKGKRRISITCRNCGHVFQKKT